MNKHNESIKGDEVLTLMSRIDMLERKLEQVSFADGDKYLHYKSHSDILTYNGNRYYVFF